MPVNKSWDNSLSIHTPGNLLVKAIRHIVTFICPVRSLVPLNSFQSDCELFQERDS